ncbi:RluA family pseudouridine synthase [Herbinix luporum]|jgi:23S rRNA pseudouridine1911/1915/1917 synthase|uniref:Pseudouridine synthase n=1 Tax=Herbinix luporum TaxID=1679721 RepID=A0A0K8J5G9_9FIRM|nr:RluA family pseudouridine synthase [Herbinix luporum]CUH92707.1 putative RNA pseudouridine synthase YlyB [Herbinix luporum]
MIDPKDEQLNISLIVEEEFEKLRIDKYLSSILDDISRSSIQKFIDEGRVLVDGKAVKSNFKLLKGQAISLYLPQEKEPEIKPENIPIEVIYEDEDIIVINKHKGLVVHPAPGHESGTLVNALLYHYKDQLSSVNGPLRPGIVHRIDRDTTGVIVVCKNDQAHLYIAKQLKEHSITRKYLALVYNTFKTESGRVEADIGRHPVDRKKMAAGVINGKYAATNYRLIENLDNKYAYIECELETGRTHQIRVHMASINHPVVGDTVYGPSKDPFKLQGQALHAAILGFIHPTTKEYVEFRAPLPTYFTDLLSKLRRL